VSDAPDTLAAPKEAPDDASARLWGSRLVILRHGEAWCNFDQTVGGPKGCRGLTARGVRQTEILAERLARTGELAGADAIWTSELPRAIETAEILKGALGIATVQRSEVFNERDPGEADGMLWSEIEGRYGRPSSAPGSEPDQPISPGGETWIGFVQRAGAALVDLVESYAGRFVILVAHGGIIDASLITFLDLPAHGTCVRFHAENSSITEWGHTGRKWRLVRYNDAAHLLDPSHGEGLLGEPPTWVHTEP
jgi:probable phosphoglycerate mutase